MVETPKNFYQKSAITVSPNKKMIGFGIVAVCGLVSIVLVAQNSGKKKELLKTDELKQAIGLYSKTEIENLIKDQLSQAAEKQGASDVSVKANAPKRKLDTDIAVYVYKPKKEGNKAEAVTKQSQELEISTGVKIKAHLANAIFSLNVTSPVVAVTDEDVVKDGKTIVPKDTQFLGEAGVVQTRDRVNVKFAVMVFPDGKEKRVQAMALSLDGSGGIKGKVDKQYDRSLLKATGEMVLSGASLVLGTSRGGPISLEDELRLNASRNLADDAQQALGRVRIEKSISVEAYTPILILFLDAV